MLPDKFHSPKINNQQNQQNQQPSNFSGISRPSGVVHVSLVSLRTYPASLPKQGVTLTICPIASIFSGNMFLPTFLCSQLNVNTMLHCLSPASRNSKLFIQIEWRMAPSFQDRPFFFLPKQSKREPVRSFRFCQTNNTINSQASPITNHHQSIDLSFSFNFLTFHLLLCLHLSLSFFSSYCFFRRLGYKIKEKRRTMSQRSEI